MHIIRARAPHVGDANRRRRVANVRGGHCARAVFVDMPGRFAYRARLLRLRIMMKAYRYSGFGCPRRTETETNQLGFRSTLGVFRF